MNTLQLTEEQQAVVISPANRLVVSAVAGAGKTTTVVQRLVARLAMGHPPAECLAITFTRASAGHIRRKIREQVGEDILATTIHGLCLRVLEAHAEELFDRGMLLTPDFTIASDWELFRLKMEIKEELGTKDSKKINAALDRRLTERGLVKVGDLLVLGQVALTEIKGAAKWSFVIVDEAQDLNDRQWGVVDALNPEWLTVVGDHAQSLYEWNGARPQVFAKRARDWDTLHMTLNWRSRPEIIELANNHLASMSVVTEPMRPVLEKWESVDEGVVVHDMFPNEGDELTTAAEIAAAMAEQGDTVAVLARYRTQLDHLCQKVAGLDVPFWTPSNNRRFWSGELAQLGVTALQALCLGSESALERLVLETLEEGGAALIENVKTISLDEEKPLLECLKDTAPEIPWWEFIDKLSPDMAVIEAAKYLNFPPLLVAHLMEWLESQDSMGTSVRHFARAVATEIEEDGLERAPICVSTIHGSKGLEWDVVIITGLNETRIPGRGGNLEEERRLLYVAMTRAKERLLLTSHGIGLSLDGRPEFHTPSRFLKELGLWTDSRIIRP